MADTALSALASASALDGTELYYTVQAGSDRKATGVQIRTLIQANSTGTGSVMVFQTAPVLIGPQVGANGGSTGAITLFGGSTGSCLLSVSSVAGAGVLFRLPNSTGTNGQLLKTDGSGNTSWVSAAGTGDMLAANNLSDVASTVSARSNLGLGTIATFNETTSTQYQANTSGKALSTDKVWAAAAPVTITDAASVTPDMSAGIDFLWTIGSTGRTINNPNSVKAGQKGVIYLVQDGTGSRTITSWGSQYKFSGGSKPVLSTASNAVDVLSYCCKSTSEVDCFFTGGMS